MIYYLSPYFFFFAIAYSIWHILANAGIDRSLEKAIVSSILLVAAYFFFLRKINGR